MTLIRTVNKERQRDYLRIRRMRVIEAYGGKCACPGCTESRWEFLCIDHIDGGGNQDRAQTGLVCNKLYLWLIKNNFPKGKYQLLCYNCNMGKAAFGVCPHIKRAAIPKPARPIKTFGRAQLICPVCTVTFSRCLSRVRGSKLKPTCSQKCRNKLLYFTRWGIPY